jgi:hypothetical protein
MMLNNNTLKPTSFISAVIIVFKIQTSNAQTAKKNDLYRWGLKGNIESVHEITYEAKTKSDHVSKGEKIINDQEIDTKVTFNNQGNTIEDLQYDKSGNLSKKFTFAYDDKMHLIEECRYGSDGNLAHTTKFVLVFDSSGNVVESNILNEEDNVNGKTIRKYDAKGNVIERQRFYASGVSKMKINYSYNDKGDMIETIWYDLNRNIIFKEIYKVDEGGKVVEEIDLEKGLKFNSKYTYVYDERGNLIEKHWYKKEEKPHMNWTYKYDYDVNNNWTQRIQYNGKKALSITERKIEYFNL